MPRKPLSITAPSLFSARAIPALIWLCCISGFSGQNGETSAGLSLMLSRLLADILLASDSIAHMLAMLGLPATPGVFADCIHLAIRKTAHFSEYMVLAWLALWWIRPTALWGKACFRAFLFCVAAAALDEVHQLFVPGRAGQALDVFIDSLGSFTGLAAASLVRHLLRRSNA